MLGEERAHERFDLVDRGDEEVARAHREVGDAEVEELRAGSGRIALVEVCGDLLQVRSERGDDGALDEVVDDDLRREVGASRLALTRRGVEVDRARRARRPRRRPWPAPRRRCCRR